MSTRTRVLYLVSLAAFLRSFGQVIYVPSLATMRGELTAPTETFETLAAREDAAPGHRDRGTAESRAGAP